MAKKASLSEIMGSAGANNAGNLQLKHLPQILGDAMPHLPRNQVGRFRLIKALQQRFGDNFRALPGVSGLVKQFDSEIEFEDKIDRIKAIKLSHYTKRK
jgi:hypothetical protein